MENKKITVGEADPYANRPMCRDCDGDDEGVCAMDGLPCNPELIKKGVPEIEAGQLPEQEKKKLSAYECYRICVDNNLSNEVYKQLLIDNGIIIKSDATNINEGSTPNQSMVEGETVEQAEAILDKYFPHEEYKAGNGRKITYHEPNCKRCEIEKDVIEAMIEFAKSTSENEKLKAEVQDTIDSIKKYIDNDTSFDYSKPSAVSFAINLLDELLAKHT